jgi:hypothetical protein
MYTTEDLKSLGEYLKKVAAELLTKDPEDEKNKEDSHNLMTILRQLEAIRFNPLLFKSILKTYKVDYALMEEPLKKVPLHINDSGIISKTIVQWRCTNNK